MNKKIPLATILFIFYCLAFSTSSGTDCHAQANLAPDVWEKYVKTILKAEQSTLPNTWMQFANQIPSPPLGSFPGRVVGNDAGLSAFAQQSAWTYRAVTYELYFASSQELARSIYGLAILSGDVKQDIPLERFERSVRGFHYSIEQVCLWVNAVLSDNTLLHTPEERRLLHWLMRDSVVDISNDRVIAGERIRHILGAAPGKKRSFEITLRHERFHVLWDEYPNFATPYKQAWQNLSAEAKWEVRKKMAGYAQGNEFQLLEEWAIYQAENMSDIERKALVGL